MSEKLLYNSTRTVYNKSINFIQFCIFGTPWVIFTFHLLDDFFRDEFDLYVLLRIIIISIGIGAFLLAIPFFLLYSTPYHITINKKDNKITIKKWLPWVSYVKMYKAFTIMSFDNIILYYIPPLSLVFLTELDFKDIRAIRPYFERHSGKDTQIEDTRAVLIKSNTLSERLDGYSFEFKLFACFFLLSMILSPFGHYLFTAKQMYAGVFMSLGILTGISIRYKLKYGWCWPKIYIRDVLSAIIYVIYSIAFILFIIIFIFPPQATLSDSSDTMSLIVNKLITTSSNPTYSPVYIFVITFMIVKVLMILKFIPHTREDFLRDCQQMLHRQ